MDQKLIALAQEIGAMVKESAEMKRVNAAQAKFDTRDDLKAKIDEYSAQDSAIRGDIDNETRKKIQDRMEELYTQVVTDPDYAEYVDAQKAVSALMNAVNEEINFAITGHRGCSHNCSECGGGCDCGEDDCDCEDGECGCH